MSVPLVHAEGESMTVAATQGRGIKRSDIFMIKRDIEPVALKAARDFPVVTLIGPIIRLKKVVHYKLCVHSSNSFSITSLWNGG